MIQRVLVVDETNQSRSFWAHFILQKMAEGRVEIKVDSAGLNDGIQPSDGSIRLLGRIVDRDRDVSEFRAKKLDEKHLAQADLVIAMDGRIEDGISSAFPNIKKPTFNLEAMGLPRAFNENHPVFEELIQRIQQLPSMMGAITTEDGIGLPVRRHSERIAATPAMPPQFVMQTQVRLGGNTPATI